jgi:hypothetical protein
MKLDVMRPEKLVDNTGIPGFAGIEINPCSIRFGALIRWASRELASLEMWV